MGEYVRLNGESVKIGTCESLYYTTLQQFKDNLPNMTPAANQFLKPNTFRFRFPFPDEAHIEIGCHADFDRGVLISVPKSLGIEMPHGMFFYRVSKTKTVEELPNNLHFGINIPCPAAAPLPYIRDWGNQIEKHTTFEVVAQKIVESEVQTVVRCPYCEEMCRLDGGEAKALHQYSKDHPKLFDKLQKEVIEELIKGYN